MALVGLADGLGREDTLSLGRTWLLVVVGVGLLDVRRHPPDLPPAGSQSAAGQLSLTARPSAFPRRHCSAADRSRASIERSSASNRDPDLAEVPRALLGRLAPGLSRGTVRQPPGHLRGAVDCDRYPRWRAAAAAASSQ